MEKVQEQYSLYLQYGLKFIAVNHLDSFEGEDFYDYKKFKKGSIWTLSGYADKELMIHMGEGEISGFIFSNGMTYINTDIQKLKLRPLLHPLDKLIDKVADWCYITQPEWFDDRESAKKWCELMFFDPLDLPFIVFNKVLSLHGDVFGLIEKGIGQISTDKV